jgi:hypothetical protein
VKIVVSLWCPVCKRMTAHEIIAPFAIQCVPCLKTCESVLPVNPVVDLVDGLLGRRPGCS